MRNGFLLTTCIYSQCHSNSSWDVSEKSLEYTLESRVVRTAYFIFTESSPPLFYDDFLRMIYLLHRTLEMNINGDKTPTINLKPQIIILKIFILYNDMNIKNGCWKIMVRIYEMCDFNITQRVRTIWTRLTKYMYSIVVTTCRDKSARCGPSRRIE